MSAETVAVPVPGLEAQAAQAPALESGGTQSQARSGRAKRTGMVAAAAAAAGSSVRRDVVRFRIGRPHPLQSATRSAIAVTMAIGTQTAIDKLAVRISKEIPVDRRARYNSEVVLAANGVAVVTGLVANRLILGSAYASAPAHRAAGVLARQVALSGIAGSMSVGSEAILDRAGVSDSERRSGTLSVGMLLFTAQRSLLRRASRKLPTPRATPVPRRQRQSR